MRTQTGGAARPDYKDRNPTDRTIYYSNTNVAPHAQTSRASRTVAAGKKGILEAVSLQLRRNQAGTVIGNSYIYVTLTPNGGSQQPIAILHEDGPDFGTVGKKQSLTLTLNKPLAAGDSVSIFTSDTTTNGSLDYYANVTLTEYDS